MCQDKVSEGSDQRDEMWVMGETSSTDIQSHVGSSLHLSTEHLCRMDSESVTQNNVTSDFTLPSTIWQQASRDAKIWPENCTDLESLHQSSR